MKARAILAGVLVLGVTLGVASASQSNEPAYPAGWHESRARLVPELLMPREVVSVGNFAMRPGGGGNCGREPSASIRRMRPGDALVTVQEYEVTARMRSHFRRTYPAGLPRLDGSTLSPPVGTDRAAVGAVRYATIPFSIGGRAFEALVYADAPDAGLRAEIQQTLGNLELDSNGPRV